jgi:hypothetical protein
MTARVYPVAAQALVDETLDWEGGTFKALLLAQGFVYSASNVHRSDIDDTFVIDTSSAIDVPEVTGEGDARIYSARSPIKWAQILDDRSAYHVVLFEDTGTPTTSRLVAYWGPDSILGTPLELNGEDYFLYAYAENGGYFRVVPGETVGQLSTTPLAANLTLGETIGAPALLAFGVYLGRRLLASDRACAPRSGVESCCQPVISRSSCA